VIALVMLVCYNFSVRLQSSMTLVILLIVALVMPAAAQFIPVSASTIQVGAARVFTFAAAWRGPIAFSCSTDF